jgi:hypothetical protein
MTEKGYQPLQVRYVNIVGACVYTGKTPDQLIHAQRKGLLRVRIAKDGTKSYRLDDLDEYMGGEDSQKSNS